RDPAAGTVRLRVDPDHVAEIEDLALRQGIETIRGRVDKFGVAEPTIIKKGTDIVVELPGLKAADFERIKSIIGRTAQLEFKIVDDGSEYMKKAAASVPIIESRIGERGRVTMGSTLDPVALQQEVQDLVAVLRSGALPAPLRQAHEMQVGPTMGKDAVEKAKFSMYIGAIAVVLFMLI